MDRKVFQDRPNYRRGIRNTMVTLTGISCIPVLPERDNYRNLFEN
jgi:hypothetical protein